MMKQLVLLSLLIVTLAVTLGNAKRLRRGNGVQAEDYKLRLKNHLNVQYSGDFTVGGQPVPVIYDTGSFEVLVLSKLCSDYSASLKVYDAAKSTTFEDLKMTAHHAFASGDVVANEGYDDLKVGDPDSTAEVKHFPFWQIKSHQMTFWHTGNAIFSGIVGLSHAHEVPEGFSGDPDHDMALLEHLNMDAFSLCLERGAAGTTPPGWLTFGQSLNDAQKDASLHWQSIKVTGHTHWAAQLSGMKVDMSENPGVDLSKLCVPSCGALVDSGTSLLSFPVSMRPLTDKLKSMVKADCSNIHELPNLYFKLGGADIVLPPKAYIYKVPTSSGDMCKGEFMEMDKESQFGESFILGMPFLRYYFTIFDKKNKMMHITKATEDCSLSGKTALVSSHSSLNKTSTQGSKYLTKMVAGFTERDYTEATHANLSDLLMPAWARPDKPKKIKF
eukprot:TRINITY_DN48510_c0_g1_i1.p1 TRINITY_DN48510_c0_g1~~TRINITY_DN48510_c0_g1_i1.p1  ORF type:complete len:443 (+),score=99.41 TRINITY_DN48510_c0_g1_i1:106-1434(+)